MPPAGWSSTRCRTASGHRCIISAATCWLTTVPPPPATGGVRATRCAPRPSTGRSRRRTSRHTPTTPAGSRWRTPPRRCRRGTRIRRSPSRRRTTGASARIRALRSWRTGRYMTTSTCPSKGGTDTRLPTSAPSATPARASPWQATTSSAWATGMTRSA